MIISKPSKITAFTLTELLVVISIIAIFMMLLMPVAARAQKKSRITAARAMIGRIENAMESYINDWNSYPPMTGRGAGTLTNPPNINDGVAIGNVANFVTLLTQQYSNTGAAGGGVVATNTVLTTGNGGPYITLKHHEMRGGSVVDPWFNPYVVVTNNGLPGGGYGLHNPSSYDVLSLGQDGQSPNGDNGDPSIGRPPNVNYGEDRDFDSDHFDINNWLRYEKVISE